MGDDDGLGFGTVSCNKTERLIEFSSTKASMQKQLQNYKSTKFSKHLVFSV